MRRGLDWYKREPRAFLDGCRAAKMTERQIAVYTVIVDLIYDHGGETPDDPKHISSYFSDAGTASVRNTIQQLVDMGKVYRVGDMLHQKRAENEAKIRGKLSEIRAEVGRLGGVSSGNSRRNSTENNALGEANASSKREAEKEESRVDKVEVGKPTSRQTDETALCVSHFNAIAQRVGWAQVQKITPARKAALVHRMADCGGSDAWCAAMDRASSSPLLTGQTGRGWRADFDWLCKAGNFTKLMEGNYDPRPNDPGPNGPRSAYQRGTGGPHDNMVAAFAFVAHRETH